MEETKKDALIKVHTKLKESFKLKVISIASLMVDNDADTFDELSDAMVIALNGYFEESEELNLLN